MVKRINLVDEVREYTAERAKKALIDYQNLKIGNTAYIIAQVFYEECVRYYSCVKSYFLSNDNLRLFNYLKFLFRKWYFGLCYFSMIQGDLHYKLREKHPRVDFEEKLYDVFYKLYFYDVKNYVCGFLKEDKSRLN